MNIPRVKRFFKPNASSVCTGTPMWRAWKSLRTHSHGLLPVHDGNQVVGTLSYNDVLLASRCGYPETSCVEEIMTHNPFLVRVNDHLEDVVKKMFSDRSLAAIVVDESHQVLGVFTAFEALELMSKFVSAEGFDRLLVQMPHNFFRLGG